MLSALELRGATVTRPTGLKRVVVEGVEKKRKKRNAAAMNARAREWRQRNPERYKESVKRYRNSPKGRAAAKRQKIRFYAKHAEALKEKARIYWHTVRKFRESRR